MLVVIDIQPDFDTAAKVIQPCQAAIRAAEKNNEVITIVEYRNHGWTFPELTNLLYGYERHFPVLKSQDGGGFEVYNSFLRKKLPHPRVIKVCGVNTNACVLETVRGLSKLFYKSSIRVLSRACNSYSLSCHDFGLEQMKRLSNVTII